jgi:hypothetical protein
MAFLLENIPRFDCLVRREYTRDLQDGHGEYLKASAEAILAVRSDSFWFQVILHEPYAGAAYLLPIEALVTKPCKPVPTKELMAWDAFSSTIGICELRSVRRGAVRLLKENLLGEYRFSVASTGSDLADMVSQRKILHVVFREDGIIGAWPNNRLIFLDRALFGDLTAKPDFLTLTKEFRAEGIVENSHKPACKDSLQAPVPTPLNGLHTDPKERPDWLQGSDHAA